MEKQTFVYQYLKEVHKKKWQKSLLKHLQKLEGSIVQAKNLVNETELVNEELIQCGLQLQDNIMKYNKYVFTKPEAELYVKVCVSMKDKTKVAMVKGTYNKWAEFKDSGYVVYYGEDAKQWEIYAEPNVKYTMMIIYNNGRSVFKQMQVDVM